MTTASLTWGSAFLAFGPAMSLLFLLAYQKAQLIIVVTTAAFAFLLAALAASFVWWIFDMIGIGNYAVFILLPGVIFQFLFRCGFVALYHRVENVIQISIRNHEEHENQRTGTQSATAADPALSESARLRLELNDWACGLAAGTGFGGMHAILLYGTLLASESDNLGTLYQSSCIGIPALVISALNTFMFTILDVLWMLLTFFGMRRRRREEASTTLTGGLGALFGNEKKGGNLALLAVFVSHFCASVATVFNSGNNGCRISIPVLGIVTLVTGIVFWAGAAAIYLPASQQRTSIHRD